MFSCIYYVQKTFIKNYIMYYSSVSQKVSQNIKCPPHSCSTCVTHPPPAALPPRYINHRETPSEQKRHSAVDD